MLRAIHIKRFGVFTDRSFALGAVTVFGGANQSGKSTLFDAIRLFTFEPDRRVKANREAFERYGDDTDVRLDWGGEAPEMTDAEFMNLFAVSAGQVHVDLNGSWLDGVKKSLFAGGIDPRNLIDTFDQLASDKGTLRHMRERKRLEDDLAATEARLEDLQGQRDEILAGLDRHESARAELKVIDARLGQRKGEESELAAEVAFQERILERGRWERHLALLEEIGKLESAQAGRTHLAQDRTAELDALEAAQRDAATRAVRAEEAAGSARRQLEGAQAELTRLDKERAARRTWPEAVAALESRLTMWEAQQLGRQMLWGFAAVLVALLGVAALVWSELTAWGWGSLAGALVLAPVVFVAPRWVGERLLLARLKDQWRNRLAGTHAYGRAQLVTEAGTLGGMASALAQVSAEVDRLADEHATRAEEVAAAERARTEADAALEQARQAAQAADGALRDWLAGMRVADRDEYRDHLGEYRRAQQRLGEAYGRLEHVLRERTLADAHALRSAAQEALAALEAEHVPGEGLPEPQVVEMRERLEAMRNELGGLERQRHELDRTSHGAAERLVGQLGTLPDELAAGYERARALREQIAALDFDRRAAGRALELFRGVATDETAVLAELSAAVAGVFARLSGVSEAQQAAVALAGLRTEDISALDRNGATRPVTHLSSGAQHLLYLALRLEMARRERQGRFALLCLDEPFAFLDPERQLETLQYLREFLEETGWQLVLFTNEPAQAERARAVFPDCQVHALG